MHNGFPVTLALGLLTTGGIISAGIYRNIGESREGGQQLQVVAILLSVILHEINLSPTGRVMEQEQRIGDGVIGQTLLIAAIGVGHIGQLLVDGHIAAYKAVPAVVPTSAHSEPEQCMILDVQCIHIGVNMDPTDKRLLLFPCFFPWPRLPCGKNCRT